MNRRYILSCCASDHSGQVWLSLFNDQAEKLLGCVTANELNAYKEQGDEIAYEKVFSDALFKTFVMRVSII
jgi:replication factor A1